MHDVHSISVIAFMLLALFGAHAYADYGIQSKYVAENKVRPTRASAMRHDELGNPVDPVAVPDNPDWFVTLGAHCLMHGLLVLATICASSFVLGIMMGSAVVPSLKQAVLLGTWLGWAETIVHFAIDDAKGQQRFSYRTDQTLHYGCKVLWISIVLMAMS